MPTRWVMPNWMRPFAPYITNTGASRSEDLLVVVERMYNGNADPQINLPLSTLQACVKSQVALLYVLHDAGGLSIPGIMHRRYADALAGISLAVRVVLDSRALPKKMRPGLQAIDDAIAEAVRP